MKFIYLLIALSAFVAITYLMHITKEKPCCDHQTKEHQMDWESYIRNCTNGQLQNVYKTELERIRNNPDSTDIVQDSQDAVNACRMVAVERGITLVH